MDATDANALANVALYLWVPVCLALFVFLKPPVAVVVAYLTATLFLPERVQIDLPGIPPLTKSSITSLCVVAGCMLQGRATLMAARPGRGLDLLIGLLLLAAIGTTLTNSAPLHYGPTTLSAMSMQDGMSMAIHDLLYFGVPFFVGRAFYRDRESVNTLLIAVVIAAVIYSAFVLVELRMSPHWHKWIYGFHQHRFGQVFRWGGYRPMVFMAHGLAVGMLYLVAALAATGLWRSGKQVFGLGAGLLAVWLTLILIACKSTGAIAYGLILIPAAALLRPRKLLFIGVAIATIVAGYPLMRAYDVFPTNALTSWANSVSAERAESMAFRFHHEDSLLEKAKERPAFGWGGYRRNRIFDDRGRDRSVTDGFWVLQLGIRGVVGFIAAFGLLLIPVVLARRRWHAVAANDRWSLLALITIVSVHAIDLIPNGLFSVLPFFFAGALAGAAKGLAEQPQAELVEQPAAVPWPQPVARTPESLY